jgi:hypothetical protein
MQLVYAVTSDFALMSTDGKPTIVGVFDAVRTRAVPFPWPRFAFVGRVRLDPLDAGTSHTMQITMRDPAGIVAAQAGGPVTFGPPPPDGGSMYFDPIMVFDNFMFTAFGQYSISLEIDSVPMGATVISIVQLVGQP